MKKLLTGLILGLILVGLIFLVSARMMETQVQIHKGWNLIFGFVEPDALSGKLELSSIKAIYVFIPTIQEYARVYPNPENNKLQSMDDDYLRQTSFWVYSDSETGKELNGVMNADEYMIEEAPGALSDHQLYGGWNFLAYIPEMRDKSLGELKGSCNIEKAYLWMFGDNSESGQWVELPMDGKFVGDKMLMMGFVAKVSSDCALGRDSGSITSPPILPTNSDTCTDTDGGENYYVKGTVTASEGGPEFSAEDVCGILYDNVEGPADVLNEKYCINSGAKETSYTCPNGCENGACIQ